MSTYYEYQDVKVMIAHKLMNMEGWKVYGYHADNSDPMTDYYDPASWGGVAEKNGYILCVNVYGKAEPQEIRQYNYNNFTYDRSIAEKISKLEQMTVERGASEAEEESAKNMIARLQKKAEEATENAQKYIVVGVIPGHMENPPKMNWHIEKDGVIIAKGNGILKYAKVDSYYRYSHYMEDMKKFQSMSREDYIKELAEEYILHGYYNEENAEKHAISVYEEMTEKAKLCAEFEKFINKLDTTCGGLLGEGDRVIYEKIKVTEYKTELKAVETENGSIKDGQLFIVKTSFNYGHNKGYVYRIHATEYNGRISYHAYKLNGKLTKECTGTANQSNHWYITENFIRWFEKGSLAWCELQEVKTPYEVEKVVKKVLKAEKKTQNAATTETTTEAETINTANYTFEVSEDTDTRTNEKIYLVKVAEKLSREEYIKVNNYIKSIGGYYSRFKHGFIFKENPTELLNGEPMENATETAPKEPTTAAIELQTEEKQEEVKEEITYTITEDKHDKTNETIFVVKPTKELSKSDFAEVKRKFATLKGFYSGYKHGFIFKYNPTEAINTA